MRVFQSTYKDRTGATRKTQRWYIELQDHRGTRRRIPAYTDRKQSEAVGRNVERLARLKVAGEALDPTLTKWVEGLPSKLRKVLGRIGLLDAAKTAALRPLREHLDGAPDTPGFRQALEAKGATQDYVELTVNRAKCVIEGCGFTFWSDLSASKVMAYLNGLRADRVVCTRKALKRLSGVEKNGPDAWIAFCPVHQNPPDDQPPRLTVTASGSRLAVSCGSGCDPAAVYKALDCIRRGASAQTFNYYLRAIRQFCRWMVKDGRASESPVAHLDGLNVRTDRRHDRRSLTVDEMRRLLTRTQSAPERFGMSGPERAMLYRLAVETGLRAGELRSLTRASFTLSNDQPTVTVEAAFSKHRRRDVLPLRLDTAAELRGFLAGKLAAATAFNMPSKWRLVGMLRRDLEAAGILYRDDTGRVVDFHGLRHTAGSLLAASGVHPKVAQSLMRHSDINLTMSRYSHVLIGQESDAVAALPDLGAPPSEAVAATGTDGAKGGDPRLAVCLAQQGRFRPIALDHSGQRAETGGGKEGPENIDKDAHLQASKVARLPGLEPGTYGLEGRCSLQLSYRRNTLSPQHLQPLAYKYTAGDDNCYDHLGHVYVVKRKTRTVKAPCRQCPRAGDNYC